jgi:hypothetical protein
MPDIERGPPRRLREAGPVDVESKSHLPNTTHQTILPCKSRHTFSLCESNSTAWNIFDIHFDTARCVSARSKRRSLLRGHYDGRIFS